MGADLGTLPARINVGIYNAGQAAATATLAIYRACDGALLESRKISVASDTAVQLGGMCSVPAHCPPETPLNTWLRYLTVTMDQPALSYIVNLADPLPLYPQVLLSVPIAP